MVATPDLPTFTWNSPVYRAHHPRWSFTPTSGEGASRLGGRFNPPGTPALYTSASVKTALLEAQQGSSYKFQPLTLCTYDVHCADMLDLVNEEARRQAGIDLAVLACPWGDMADRGQEPPSWPLASRLMAQGVAGIRVPSFARGAGTGDINLVFWSWSDKPPHQVTVIDDESRLPKDDSSWR